MTTLNEILKSKDTVVVDVRSPLEYQQEHIEGARNIPVEKINDHIRDLKELHKPIVVYCRSGARSGMALGILQQHGLASVYNGGGIEHMKTLIN